MRINTPWVINTQTSKITNQTHFSTNTRGIRINDEFKPSKIKYRYTAEYALQENKYNNPKT